MAKIGVAALFVLMAALLVGAWPVAAWDPGPPRDRVDKTVCFSALGYVEMERLKEELLNRAKRDAVEELFGEVIGSITVIDNLVVTSDQVRLRSIGLIRVEGSPRYANGADLGDVCVSITAYVTPADRLLFVPYQVSDRSCINGADLTVPAVRVQAEEKARVQALVQYDIGLQNYAVAAILPLLRRVEIMEDGVLEDTDSFCVTVTGDVIPIEVLSFLSLAEVPPTPTATHTPEPLAGSAAATATSYMATLIAYLSRTPTPTPQPTPTPNATVTAAALLLEVFATAEARSQTILDAAVNPVDQAVYVYVQEGEFVMGSGDGDEDEQPVHLVELDAFWIMRTEVTNRQYSLCVAAGICTAPRNAIWKDVRFPDHPVTGVDWDQAATYAGWVGGRLPSEAEWEKACRSGDQRLYPWGDAPVEPALLNYSESGHGTTTAVGSYPNGASPYGALDMTGNVWEWTADWYGADYYSQSPEEEPPGPDRGDNRVLRGGSWSSAAPFLRCSFRYKNLPGQRTDGWGFRVVSTGF